MPDLLLQLTPNTTIRGTSTVDESCPVFAVYDFIDVVGRPPVHGHKRKRGAFSRDFWSRLTFERSARKTELEGLVSEAPIRASLTLNRTAPVPVMTVSGL
jgi:hypothetical protein